MSAQLAPEKGRLWHFHGGLHLDDHKTESTGLPIAVAAVPQRLVVPLDQHIGRGAEPLVKPGDKVLRGQIIGRPSGFVSASVHAPTSGRVVAIADLPVPHPSGLSAPCVVLEADGEDRWAALPEPLPDYRERDAAELRERVRWAGIVGLGGAGFPTSVKLNPGADQPVHTLIINGAECEPYITSDDMLMREQAERVVAGIGILLHMLGAERCIVGIEDNKPEAIGAMNAAVREAGLDATEVVAIPTLYPSGGEKQLIRILTGLEVPSNGIPAELGMVCQNVGTATAVADAVLEGRPLTARVVTITGDGVTRPQNYLVRIGTPVADLVSAAGGYHGEPRRLIFGGPMMGFTLADDDVPVVKGCNCLIAATEDEAPSPPTPGPCIRCGECARVCPANLLPQQLYWHARARDFDKTQDYHLFDCIECGCCAHVCPSHIPLVQYYRFAKTEVWARERDKRKADHARQRHEFREARLARLEQERKARLRKKKEALAKPAGDDKAGKQAAIDAAMKRVAAKKAAQAAAGNPAPETADQHAAPREQD